MQLKVFQTLPVGIVDGRVAYANIATSTALTVIDYGIYARPSFQVGTF